MVEVFNRIDVNYSLKDFDSDKKEKEAVKAAKREAVKTRYSFNEITEIGSGSGERTTIYKTDNEAIKVICCQTKKCFGENLEEEKKKLCRKVELNSDCRESIMNEIQCWMKLKSTDNIIPMYGFEIFSWTCPEYDRIGVDCAVKMALAECMTDKVTKYILRKQGSIMTEKPESQDLIIQIGIDICTALTAIHSKKLVHRDIKPDNIFWLNEKFCLGDFGIALDQNNPQYLYGKAEKEWKKGTPVYWSPQQADGDIVDHRTDIYSLGLVLYELADTVPMSSHYDDRIHDHMLTELGSDVSEGLKVILRNACAYSPDHRYQTAEAFKNDLCRLKDDPTYIPESTESKFKQKMKQIETSYISEMGFRSNKEISKNSRFRKLGINNQRNLEKYLCPETVWNAGKFWYDESCKPGSRFAGLYIDKRIMPLTLPKPHVTDFPVNITTNPECNSEPIPLSEIIEHTENLHNMYLIGEGGIGKTTALHSIMKDAYKNKVFVSVSNETFVIPLFVELSKAPASYCNTYKNKQSTFIQRYLFTLISSLAENHLIFESSYEMTAVMEMEADSIIKNIRHLLNSGNPDVKYLLLLDGLNEISRKQLTDNKNNHVGTPAELIVDEIQELLKYQNVSVVITSRADEALRSLDSQFDRLYLTGVSETVIKKYLGKDEFAFKAIQKNKRLMKTLKIPLFLKLYSQLYSTSEVSTPGEILYTFFSEHSTKYSMHNRISEIVKDRRTSGNTHSASLSDERMQWFILDFLLPELGWYMEKNDLYTVDRATIQNVMDSVLKGTSETDICGKYGVAMFSDYCNRNDGSINVKTYADKLLEMDSDESYIQKIVDYCVYSLGILYVNNQDYGFIHQHIRDFFAAIKIITDMKKALYIAKASVCQEISLQCLKNIDDSLVSNNVGTFIGEILGEYLNTPQKKEGYWTDITPSNGKRALVTNVINLCRNQFSQNSAEIHYNIVNLLKIVELSRHTFNGFNFSYLDLRNCHFNTKSLKNADMTGCLLERNSFFPESNCGEIRKAAFSKSGEYIYIAGEDKTLSLWHRKTFTYIKTIKKYNDRIYNISTSEKYIAVSTNKETEILDVRTFEVIKTFKAYNAVFSPNGKYITLAFNRKKAQVCDTESFNCICKLGYMLKPFMSDFTKGIDLICYSSDNKHLAIVTQEQHLFSNLKGDFAPFIIQIWDIEKRCYFQIKNTEILDKTISIDFSDTDNLLLVTKASSSIIEIYSISDTWDTAVLRHSIDIEECMSSPSTCAIAKFIQNDTTIAISLSSGELFFLDYKKYEKEHILHVSKKKEHELSISSMTKFKNSKGSFLLTGSMDHTVKLWDAEQLHCIGAFNNMNFHSITSAIFANNGKYLVTSGQNNSILIWDLKSQECIDTIGNFPLCTRKMAYHDEKQLLAVAILDGRVLIYHFNNTTQVFSYLHTLKMQDWEISKLEFSVTGEYLLATGYDSPYITVYNFNTNKQTIIKERTRRIQCASFYEAGGKTVLIGSNKLNRLPEDILPNENINSPNNECILKIYSSDTGKFIGEIYSYIPPYYESKFHHGTYFPLITTTAASYKDQWLKATSIDYTNALLYLLKSGTYIEVLDLNTNRCIAILSLNQRYAIYYDWMKLSLSNKGTYITITSRTPNTEIFQTNKWKSIYSIIGLWPDNKRFGFINNRINRIQYSRYKKYNGHQDSIMDISFSPDERVMLTASSDGTVKIWPLPSKDTNTSSVLTASYTLKCIAGIRTQGLRITNLHQDSNLSDEDKRTLEQYGAITK